MNKTTQEIVEDLLLQGKHINKFDLLSYGNSVCLAQRILDIRQSKGWNIRSASVKGKGTLKEYWLDKEEICKLKGGLGDINNEKEKNCSLNYGNNEIAEGHFEEQLGLGLLGTSNY